MSQILDSESTQRQPTAASTKPGTVRAVAMTAPGDTEMRTYPYPTMDHDSAILKVDMAGICGTDRHIYKGEATELRGKSIFPYVGGHEVIGTIVEIGDNAAKVMDYDKQLLAGWRSSCPSLSKSTAVTASTVAKHYNNTTCLNQIQAYGLASKLRYQTLPSRRLRRVHVHPARNAPLQGPRRDADRHRRLRRRNGGCLSFARSSCRPVRTGK